MIIDGHNHVGNPDRGDGKRQTPEEIVTEMDKLGIDKAVIFSFHEIEPGISYSYANNNTAEAVIKYSDRLIGFARLDPNYGEKAIEELKRSIDMGLQGLKLHPSTEKFSLRDRNLIDIIKVAEDINIPVIFDSGKKESPPEHFGELAQLCPDATIIMAHMHGDFLDITKTHDNIYLQTTAMSRKDIIINAIDVLGADKIMMGSDSPYISMKTEFDKIISLDISEKDRKLIMGENIKKILKM